MSRGATKKPTTKLQKAPCRTNTTTRGQPQKMEKNNTEMGLGFSHILWRMRRNKILAVYNLQLSVRYANGDIKRLRQITKRYDQMQPQGARLGMYQVVLIVSVAPENGYELEFVGPAS